MLVNQIQKLCYGIFADVALLIGFAFLSGVPSVRLRRRYIAFFFPKSKSIRTCCLNYCD
jgi:hypothetical protein